MTAADQHGSIGSDVAAADAAYPWRACLTLWAIVAAGLAIADWGRIGTSLGTMDDAMRMVQVRALLGGAPWFDPTETALAGGYLTHWSRLVDAPIVALIRLFGWVASPQTAERLARTAWPLLTLAPVIMAVAALAQALARESSGPSFGRAAGVLAAQMGVLCIAGLSVFRPGAVDHHNLQIALALTGLACAIRLGWISPDDTALRRASDRLSILGGAACALCLAIGLEALHLVALTAATISLRGTVDVVLRRRAILFMATLGLVAVLAFGVATPAALRAVPVCDALGPNLLAGLVCACAGSCVALWLTAHSPLPLRLGAVAFAGALGGAVVLVLGPQCLAGPFGRVDPALWPLWLDHVEEANGLVAALRIDAGRTLAFAAFPMMGLVVLAGLLATGGWREGRVLVLGFAFCLSVLAMLAAMRMATYANWLAVPLVAVAVLRLARASTMPDRLRLAGLALLNPLTVALAAQGVVMLATPGIGSGDGSAARIDMPAPVAPAPIVNCLDTASIAALRELPSGLAFAHLDLGPYLLAETALRVAMAPYHRLSGAIISGQRLFAGPADAAEGPLRAMGAAYVIDCAGLGNPPADKVAGSLRNALVSGPVPGFLEPVIMSVPTPIRVWRLRPD